MYYRKKLNPIQNKVIKELATRELARRHILAFTKYTFPKFQPTWFHVNFYRVLQAFVDKHINKLILSMPPQHGKTEGSSRRLPAFMFGRNPGLKGAVVQYSSTKARKTGREIKQIIQQPTYKNLFPKTTIPKRSTTLGLANNSELVEFQAADGIGNLILTGRGGGLTGEPLDFLGLDDILKDAAEAYSPVIRQNCIDFYDTVAESRLHNESQQLITTTRWHDKDIVGYLKNTSDFIILDTWEQLENPHPDVWYILNFEALKMSAPTEIDPREEGAPLYPERHSQAKLESTRARLTKNEPEKWNSLYQGDPRPVSGLLYGAGFKTWTELPELETRLAAVDVADTGKDYLCVICYGVGVDGYLYGLDFYYTTASQEITEGETVDMLIRNKINRAHIESNAGGRAFARAVERILKERREALDVAPFNQSANKEARVRTNAANLMRCFLMPEGWINKFPVFAEAVLSFKKMFRANDFDDGPDALTMAYEHSGLAEADDEIIVEVV